MQVSCKLGLDFILEKKSIMTDFLNFDANVIIALRKDIWVSAAIRHKM